VVQERAHLGPNGEFSGVAHITPEGNVREVPREIVFSGTCRDGKPVIETLDWSKEESVEEEEGEASDEPQPPKTRPIEPQAYRAPSRMDREAAELDKRMWDQINDDK